MRRAFLIAGAGLVGVGLWLWLREQGGHGVQSGMAAGSTGVSFSPSPPWDYFGTGTVAEGVDAITSALSAMGASQAGREAIEHLEGGMKLTAYPDPPGSGRYSIGIGHAGAHAGQVITTAQGWQFFDDDIAAVEHTINDLVKVPLSQGQYDALADFIFNEGVGHFETSTLLKLLNAGDYAGAAAQLPRWDYAGGQVNEDLEARRAQDQQEFQG